MPKAVRISASVPVFVQGIYPVGHGLPEAELQDDIGATFAAGLDKLVGQFAALFGDIEKALNTAAAEVGFDGWGIVEQDMYPAPFDKPLPIAVRNREFLRENAIG